MEVINYEDIDFSKLNKLDVNSSESDIYVSKTENGEMRIYKIFKSLDSYMLTLKSEKLKLLEKKINSSIVIPSAKIVNPSLVGTVENYIEGIDLCDSKCFYSDEEIIDILLNISMDLEQMHKNNMIVSDLNFGNIRLDKNKKHYFLDVLSYCIYKIPSCVYPYLLKEYLKRNKKKLSSTKNNDKISFLLFTIQLLIDKYFYDITDYDFDKKSERVKKLNYLKDVYLDLKNGYVKDIPYLHELII